MTGSFVKEALRSIKNTLNRFISIVAIVMLGVAFFAGIRATGPDMRITADRYYDEFQFMDIRLVSTLGFDEDDIAAIKSAEDVKQIMPSYSVEVLLKSEDKGLAVRLISYTDENIINAPNLISGRMPENPGEILIDSALSGRSYDIGSRVTFYNGSDGSVEEKLCTAEYTVVGKIKSPIYISVLRGSSSVGSGELDGFFYLPESEFTLPAYTDVYVISATADGLSRFSDKYETALEPIKQSFEDIGETRSPLRLETLKSEGQAEIDDAKIKLSDARQQLANAEQELSDAAKKIENGQKEYDDGAAKYNQEIAKAQKELDDAEQQLVSAKATLDEKEKEYTAGQKQLEESKTELKNQKAKLQAAIAGQDVLLTNINAMKGTLALLMPGTSDYIALEQQIITLTAQYNAGKAEADTSAPMIAAAEAQIAEGEYKLKEGGVALAAGKSEYNAQKAKFDEGKSELLKQKRTGEKNLAEAKSKLTKAKSDYAAGLEEYNEKKAEAEPEIAQAEADIAEGERELNKLENPKWYVLDVNQNAAFADYKANCDRIEAIGQVFPLIFFLVAVLVSLTAMTRMVENDRQQIGVLKALGYGKAVIVSKYVVYALMASIIGCGLGFAIGFTLFPMLIANAYGILYRLPSVVTSFNVQYALISGVAATLCATLPALLVCLTELREKPAELTLPKAPKPGKRIFLERIKPIWKRLSFTHKVTMRNIFRYKKRLLMTVIGVAGCTALIYTGFGLRELVSDIAPIQFKQIRHYDMDAGLKSDITDDEIAEIRDQVSKDENIKNYLFSHQQAVDITVGNQTQSAFLVVPQNVEEMTEFITIRQRQGKKPVTLNDDSVVITEKAANMLKIKSGDTVSMMDSDNKQVTVTMDTHCENYIQNYVFMTPALYQKLYGEPARINQIFGQLVSDSEEAEAATSERLLQNNNVSSVSFNTAIRDNFDDMIGALRYVVLVLIFSAGALAFVVLFSLTSINIDERKRELATLKVLGFTRGETASYVFREGILLSVLGGLIGLGFGVILHRYVIVTAEVSMVMFVRNTSPLSALYSFVLTLGFTGLVTLLMTGRLKKIDMAGSLKSVD